MKSIFFNRLNIGCISMLYRFWSFYWIANRSSDLIQNMKDSEELHL